MIRFNVRAILFLSIFLPIFAFFSCSDALAQGTGTFSGDPLPAPRPVLSTAVKASVTVDAGAPTGTATFSYVVGSTTDYVCPPATQTTACPLALTTNGNSATYNFSQSIVNFPGSLFIQFASTGGDYTIDSPLISATLNNNNTTLTLTTTNPDGVIYGTGVSLSGSVVNAKTGAVPAGSVTLSFISGGSTSYVCSGGNIQSSTCSLTLDASGNYTLTNPVYSLPAGSYFITATYSSSNGFTSSTLNLAQTITPKILAVASLTANNKVYDSTTNATLSGTAGFLPSEAFGSGTVTDGTPYTNDTVSLTGTPVGTFASANVGTGITVDISGLTLAGAQDGNYVLGSPEDLVFANITAAPLTITAATYTKTYDSTTSALGAQPTVSGLQGSDKISGLLETYSNPNAGTGKTLSVSPSYVVNDGNNGNNYSVTTANNTTGVVSPASLTITAASNTKTYDGTTSAAAVPAYTPLQGSDSVSNLAEVYADANAGTGKTLSVTAYTVNDGNNGNNYAVTTAINTTGVINPATPVVSATGGTFTYNGNPQGGTGTATGVISDNLTPVTLSYAGTGTTSYSSATAPTNAGTYTVTASYAASGNYASASSAAVALTINPATPTVSATGGTFTYNGNPQGGTGVATGVAGAILTPVTLSYAGTGATSYSSGTAPTNVGTYTVTASYAASGNYTNASSTAAALTINPATPIVSATGGTFTYNGNPQGGAGSATGVNSVNLTPVTLSYAGTGTTSYSSGAAPTNVGTYTVSASYAGSGNYTNASSTAAALTITPAASVTTVTCTGAPFTYNGTAQTPCAAVATGVGGLNQAVTPVNYSNNVNVGQATASASFSGDANHAASSGSTTFMIMAALPPVVVNSPTAYYGQQETLTATVDGLSGGAAPAGSVTFSFVNSSGTTPVIEYICADGSLNQTACQVPLTPSGSNATASVSTSNLPAGVTPYQVLVQYTAATGGDYANNNTTLSATVNDASTIVTLTSTNTSGVTYGTAVTLSGSVTDATPNSTGIPTGSVTLSFTLNSTTSYICADGSISTSTTCTVPLDNNGNYVLVNPTYSLPAGNYSITATYSGDSNFTTNNVNLAQIINAKILTITGLTASNKVYDATATATISGTAALSAPEAFGGSATATDGAPYNGDTISLTGIPTGTFVSVNVGSNITVNINGLALAGPQAGNYQLGSPEEVSAANITAAPLTITAVTNTKAYDGTTSAAATPTASGLQGVDVITGSAETYADPSAGTGKTLSVSAYTVNDGNNGNNYTVTTVNNTTGVITPAPLTVTANPVTITYGQTPSFTVTYGGFVGSDNSSNLGGTLAFSTQPLGNNVGSYSIVPGGLTSSNYTISFVNGTLTISQATSTTTVTCTGAPFVYNGTAQMPCTAVATGAGGLNQTLTVTYSNNVNAGTATANATFAGDPNHTGSNGSATFMIGAAPLTVTATNATKIYGAANPAFTASYSGFATGDSPSSLGGALSFATSATAASSVGSYSITPSGLTSANYAIAFAAGTLTVTPATLTLTANNATMSYGGTIPTFTAAISGFVNNDSSSVVSGSPSLSTGATTSSPVGTYPIIAAAGTLSSANYTFTTFVNGTLTVTKATATITFGNLMQTYAASPLSPTVTTAPANLVFTLTGAPDTYVNAGGYPVTATITDSNYMGSATGTFMITPAPLSVTANSYSRMYGSANPNLAGTLVGVLGSDGITATFGTTAIQSSPVGNYPTRPSLNDPNSRLSNYAITSTFGTLTVTSAVLTVTANNAAMIYGSALPTFTATINGFVNSDSPSVVSGSPSLTTGATSLSNPGSYAITAAAGNLSAANYTFTFVNGTLNIGPDSPVLAVNNPGAFTYGDPVTLTVTAAAPSGGVTPTGSVTFSFTSNGTTYFVCANGSVSSSQCTVPLANGTVSVTTSSLPAGISGGQISVQYTATTNGDYASDSTTISASVNDASSNVTLTSTNISGVTYGTAVMLSGSVTDATPGSTGIPTGSVTLAFVQNSTTYYICVDGSISTSTCSINLVNGTYTLTGSMYTMAAGNPIVAAIYSGDSNFSSSAVNLMQTVTPKTLTITGLTANNKVYDATTNATFSGSAALLAAEAFGGSATDGTPYNGDNVYLTGTPSGMFASVNVGNNITVNINGLTLAGTQSGNYKLTSPELVSAANITPAPLTITASTNTKVYDATVSATATPTVSGLQGEDTVAGLSEVYTNSSAGTGKTLTVSAYVLYDGDGGNNYAVTTVNNTTGVITPAPLTVTANPVTITYGQTPTFTASYSGFVGNDATSSLGGALAFSTQPAGSGVGSYTITPAGLTSTNYNISFVTGTLTINKAASTTSVTCTGGPFVYSGSAQTPCTATATGAGGLSQALTVTYTNNVNAGTATASATFSGDANHTGSTGSTTFTIGSKALTVTANNATKTYATANPAFTASYTGFVTGDGPSSLAGTLSLTTTATTSSPVGTYSITPSGLTSTNYSITFVAGTLTVTKASLKVTANNASMPYGGPIPTFSATVSGFVNGDTSSVVSGSPSLTTTATTTSAVGTYPITAAVGSLSAANYTFTPFVNGTLTVTKATATIGLSNLTQTYTSTLLSPTVTTVPAGLSVTLTGAPDTSVGSYTVTATISNANYTGSATGTFVINKAPLSVTANSISRLYGAANPVLTGTLTGVLGSDGITATYTTTAISTSAIGTYPITPVLSDPNNRLSNYTVTSTNGTLSVIFGSPLYVTSYACSALTMSGSSNTIIDSYDSAQGSYSATKSNSDGNISVNGSTTLSGNATIYGTLYTIHPTVGNCNQGHGVTISGNAKVTGGYSLLTPITFLTPTITAGTTNITLSSSQTETLSPGNYGDINLSGQSVLTLKPGVYNINSIHMSGQSQLVVSPTGAVVLNVAGKNDGCAVTLSGQSVNGVAGIPANFLVVYGGTGMLTLSGQAASAGIIYAPNATVTLSGQGGWYGSMVVYTLDDSGGSSIHYDRALGQ